MNKKERKANQVLAGAKEVVKVRLSHKAVMTQESLESKNIIRTSKAYAMKVGILKVDVPTDKIISIRQGVILKGQCVLFDFVSPSSVRVISNDGRAGICWSYDVVNSLYK